MQQLALFEDTSLTTLTPDELMEAIIGAPDADTLLNEATRRDWPDTMTASFRRLGYLRADYDQRIVEAANARRYGWEHEVAALERQKAWRTGEPKRYRADAVVAADVAQAVA